MEATELTPHYKAVKRAVLAQFESREYHAAYDGTEQGKADRPHFLEVVEIAAELWKEKTGLPAPEAVSIAALCHDLDRVFPERQAQTKDVPQERYAYAKGVHAGTAALLLFASDLSLPRGLLWDACFLILRQEQGGDRNAAGVLQVRLDEFTKSFNLHEAADIVFYADKLSFFTSNILEYRNRGRERLLQKIRFSAQHLPGHIRRRILAIRYEDPLLAACVKEALLLK